MTLPLTAAAVVMSLMLYATPRSVADGLANLRYSQAPAAAWAGLQPGSSVTYRRVGKSKIVGAYTEVVTQVMTDRQPGGLGFEMRLESGERYPWLSADADKPQLAAAQAQKIGEEDLFVGKKRFRTTIYSFTYSRLGRDYQQIYWLAAGVPDGVVKHRETVVWDPTYTDRTETTLTDLDVKMRAGTKSVTGYCVETIEGLRNGVVKRDRVCLSSDVPGAVVTGETRETDGGNETSYAVQSIVRFNAVR